MVDILIRRRRESDRKPPKPPAVIRLSQTSPLTFPGRPHVNSIYHDEFRIYHENSARISETVEVIRKPG
jgi:hypothetical protein